MQCLSSGIERVFDVRPMAGALGAELHGVDLTRQIDDSVLAEVHRLLLEHEVIFFRDQPVSPAQLVQIARHFGPLQRHPTYDCVVDYPEIAILESTPEVPSKIEDWHSDMTFKPHPPMGAVLRSTVCPARGGDTLWSSMTAAYGALSSGMQTFLEGLVAVHDFRWGFRHSIAESEGTARFTEAIASNPPVEHPVIHTHPETGKRVIFVNALFTTHIKDLPASESEAILGFLFKHLSRDEFTCRFSWQTNSIAIWDNRSTQHKPVNDYFPAHRRLERVSIAGHHAF